MVTILPKYTGWEAELKKPTGLVVAKVHRLDLSEARMTVGALKTMCENAGATVTEENDHFVVRVNL
jgi:hypothetical protein